VRDALGILHDPHGLHGATAASVDVSVDALRFDVIVLARDLPRELCCRSLVCVTNLPGYLVFVTALLETEYQLEIRRVLKLDWIHQLEEPVGSPHEKKFCRRRRLVRTRMPASLMCFSIGLAILWVTELFSSDAKGSLEFCEA
jgi:hypothetical protein